MSDDSPHSLAAVTARVADRCTSRGRRGVVSSAAPEAAVIGRDAFRAGGNAFDAALAAALAETVLVPSKCGLAGDLVALCRRPGERLRALVAIGPAPQRLGAAVARTGVLPVTGGLSVGVPAAPAGYAALAELGALGLAHAVRPAVELATAGVPWSPLSDRYVRRAARVLAEQNPDGTPYLPVDGFLPVGAPVTLPGLARVLEQFAAAGADLFAGELGAAVVAEVGRRGGVLSRDDFAAATARWEEPAGACVGGRDVWATPGPTHGPSLLAALTAAGVDADPATLWRAVDDAVRERARAAGDATDGGTSIVAAADAAGNSVVLVHSNSHPTFASGIVVPGYDLVLANRAGRGFTAEPGHPNFPAPGRRPVTTLHAWAVGPADAPTLLGATSGGENQMPWNAQVLQRLLAGEAAPRAVLAPLWARTEPGRCDVEQGHPDSLRSVAEVADVPLWALTSGMQVVQLDGPMLQAVSDIRSIGGTAAI